MKYIIEVDEAMVDVLNRNANKDGKNVPAYIAEIVKRYVIDAHIMEQEELWRSGAEECAELELELAK